MREGLEFDSQVGRIPFLHFSPTEVEYASVSISIHRCQKVEVLQIDAVCSEMRHDAFEHVLVLGKNFVIQIENICRLAST